MTRLTLTIVAAVVGIAAAMHAQQSSLELQIPEAPWFRAGVDLIATDVQVISGNGTPVAGLRADQFTVSIDGRPHRVVSADFVRYAPGTAPAATGALTAGSPSAPTSASRNPDPGRVFMLAVDLMSFKVAQTARMRDAAKTFIQHLDPRDLVGLMAYPTGSMLAPTANHEAIMKALDGVYGSRPESQWHYGLSPSELTALDPDVSTPQYVMEVQTQICHEMREDSTPGELQTCRDAIANERELMFREAENQIPGSLGMLRPVLSVLSDSPRRKTLVLLSGGLILRNNNDLGQDIGREAARANTTIYSLFDDVVFREATSASAKRNVRPYDNRQQDSAMLSRWLQETAGASGGRFLNVVQGGGEPLFDRILLETSAYYVLGIEPDDGDRDGKSHEVVIKVNAAGASVRGRNWVMVPKTGPVNAVATANAAATAVAATAPRPVDAFAGWDIAAADMPLRVAVASFAHPEATGKTALTIALGLLEPAAPASAGPAPRDERVEIATAAVLRETGEVVDRQRQVFTVTWSADAPQRDFEALSKLVVPPGRYELRLGIKLGNGRTAYTTTTVEAPDFSREGVAVSDIVLYTAVSGPVVSSGAFNDIGIVTPTTQRTFGGGDRVKAMARVYQGGTSPLVPVDMTARVTDDTNDVVVRDAVHFGAGAFTAARTADYDLDVAIKDLAPGDYVLTVESTAGGKTSQRTVKFRVR